MKLNFNRKELMLDLKLAVIRTYNISFLPYKIETLYNTMLMRIFRVVGGFSLILIISGKYNLFFEILHPVIFVLGIIQSILISIIFLIKLVYGLYIIIFKPELFIIRNSPVRPISSFLTRVLTCAKYGCQGVGVGTSLLSTAMATDEVLAASGRPRVCIPFIAARFNDVFGEPFGDEHMKNLKEAAKSENPEPKPLDIPKMWDDLSLEQRNEIIELVNSKTKK